MSSPPKPEEWGCSPPTQKCVAIAESTAFPPCNITFLQNSKELYTPYRPISEQNPMGLLTNTFLKTWEIMLTVGGVGAEVAVN